MLNLFMWGIVGFIVGIATMSIVFGVSPVKELSNILKGLQYKKSLRFYEALNKQTDVINEIKLLIDKDIDLYVAKKIKQEVTLEKSYNPINIDKDIKDVSTKVFNNINTVVLVAFSENSAIYNTQYWLEYIVGKTEIVFLSAYKALKGNKE